MAVTLQRRTYSEYDLNTLQSDVATAVEQLSLATQPSVSVLSAAKSQSLQGTEDYVLVDMSTVLADVYLLLPAPSSMTKAVTVSLIKAGIKKLYVKASDGGTVLINASSKPVQVVSSITVVATATQFYTV